MASAKDFFNVQLGDPILFSYRFDSSYGEFLNMGGTLNLNSPAEDEILPEFSFYSWINKSDLLHERWLIGLKKSSVSTGQLIGIGKNMGIWWSPLK